MVELRRPSRLRAFGRRGRLGSEGEGETVKAEASGVAACEHAGARNEEAKEKRMRSPRARGGVVVQRGRGTTARTQARAQELSHDLFASKCLRRAVWRMTPARLEPAILGSVSRCLVHWAMGPPALQQQMGQEWQERRLLRWEVEV